MSAKHYSFLQLGWWIVPAMSPGISSTRMKSISVTSAELYFHLTEADRAPNSSADSQDLTHQILGAITMIINKNHGAFKLQIREYSSRTLECERRLGDGLWFWAGFKMTVITLLLTPCN